MLGNFTALQTADYSDAAFRAVTPDRIHRVPWVVGSPQSLHGMRGLF